MRNDGRRGPRRSHALAAVLVVACAAVLGACGGSNDQADPSILPAGQLNIKLPAGFKVVDGKVQRPASAKGGTTATTAPGQPTETTIVSTNQDPTTALFTAFGKFRSCLDQSGVKFIGAPNAADPNSPTNDPTYIKGLTVCAARSNIQQALAEAQKANDNLTPEQIKTRNKGYLIWRTCMINKGWQIAEPVPDAQGRLFNFGGGGAQNAIVAPPGKDLLSSPDLQQCAAKSQKAVGKG
jgi:hypothetical protein